LATSAGFCSTSKILAFPQYTSGDGVSGVPQLW
jgi:hypothetical protein